MKTLKACRSPMHCNLIGRVTRRNHSEKIKHKKKQHNYACKATRIGPSRAKHTTGDKPRRLPECPEFIKVEIVYFCLRRFELHNTDFIVTMNLSSQLCESRRSWDRNELCMLANFSLDSLLALTVHFKHFPFFIHFRQTIVRDKAAGNVINEAFHLPQSAFAVPNNWWIITNRRGSKASFVRCVWSQLPTV